MSSSPNDQSVMTAKLLIQSGGQTGTEFILKSGSNRIGRSVDCDFQIMDASVSSRHCDILWTDGNLLVRDLGSTNGSFIDGQKISEARLQPGQTLRIGNVGVACFLESVVVPEKKDEFSAQTGLRVAPSTPSAPPPLPLEPVITARQYMQSAPVHHGSFFQRLPSAFSYPFKKNGLILLIAGTIFFSVGGFLPGLVRLATGVFYFGYMAAYFQKIILSSAEGEEDMPAWPDFSNWWDDIVQPAVLMGGTILVSLSPLLGVSYFCKEWEPASLMIALLAAGTFSCAYLPMALLATAMYDSLMALNPLLILPSMVKIPKEYFVCCLLLAVLILLEVGGQLLTAFIPGVIISYLVSGFLGLYFFALETRILGMMYNAKKRDLGWSF